MTTIQETIRKALDADGRSRYKIARAAGIGHATLSKFHHGGTVNLETLEALAAVLGVTVQATAPKPKKGRKA